MNESAQMERSGRRVYQDLLAFRAKTKKHVYVLASHSHFLIEDAYNDACHSRPETLLPGRIVGTAGAIWYRLRAYRQVTAEKIVADLIESAGGARVFVAYHTAPDALSIDQENITLIGPEALAENVVDLGLTT